MGGRGSGMAGGCPRASPRTLSHCERTWSAQSIAKRRSIDGLQLRRTSCPHTYSSRRVDFIARERKSVSVPLRNGTTKS